MTGECVNIALYYVKLNLKINVQYLIRFVPKCPKFCRIFIFIVILEEIDESPDIPHGFGLCPFRILGLFLANKSDFF